MRLCTDVVINGVLAATLPIGRSFGFAPAFTSRSTIELDRADRRGGNRFLGGPSRSLPNSINLRAIETSSRSIAYRRRISPSSLDPSHPERVSSSRASSSRKTHRFIPAAASNLAFKFRKGIGRSDVVFDLFGATVYRYGDKLGRQIRHHAHRAIWILNDPIGVAHLEETNLFRARQQ